MATINPTQPAMPARVPDAPWWAASFLVILIYLGVAHLSPAHPVVQGIAQAGIALNVLFCFGMAMLELRLWQMALYMDEARVGRGLLLVFAALDLALGVSYLAPLILDTVPSREGLRLLFGLLQLTRLMSGVVQISYLHSMLRGTRV